MKNDDLGDRLAVVGFDEDVGRLQILMDDPFLMCVLHRRANLKEQTETLRNTEFAGVAEFRERDALRQRTLLAGGRSVQEKSNPPANVSSTADSKALACEGRCQEQPNSANSGHSTKAIPSSGTRTGTESCLHDYLLF